MGRLGKSRQHMLLPGKCWKTFYVFRVKLSKGIWGLPSYPGSGDGEEDIRNRRLNPPGGPRLYLRVWIPGSPTNFEDSLYWDVYDNVVELVDVSKARPEPLGYVTAKGLKREKPEKKDYLWPGWREKEACP